MESCQDHDCSRRASCRRYNFNADGYGNFKEWRGCECDAFLPFDSRMTREEYMEARNEEMVERFRNITGWGR